MASAFEKWTIAFFGKGGLSLKRGWHGEGTKEEAEAEAAKYGNVVALPLQLFLHVKHIEHRMVVAEQIVNNHRVELENAHDGYTKIENFEELVNRHRQELVEAYDKRNEIERKHSEDKRVCFS